MRSALTILRSYHHAGQPSQGVKPFGRFEEWSKQIREALIWAGAPDPVLTREDVIEVDSKRENAALNLFRAWNRAVVGPIKLGN